MKEQLTINGVTFNLRVCYALGEERFRSEVVDVCFAAKKPAERAKIAEKVWKMILKFIS